MLDELRDDPDVRVTGMRNLAGTMSVDVDLQGHPLAERAGVTVERLGTEDTVIALTGEPES